MKPQYFLRTVVLLLALFITCCGWLDQQSRIDECVHRLCNGICHPCSTCSKNYSNTCMQCVQMCENQVN